MPILACMVIEVRFHLRGPEAPRLNIGLLPSYFNTTMFRFYGDRWQPVQCEYADRVEQEHLQRFLSHKMADYVWDATTSTRLEKQVSRGKKGEGTFAVQCALDLGGLKVSWALGTSCSLSHILGPQ